MRETGLCIRGLLEEQEDGTYLLPVSSSPEIHDDTEKAWIKPISNYDLSLLHYLFETLENMAKELGLEEEKKWQEIRKRLPELTVNEKHVLMLSKEESLMESHRHLANAMAISPLEQIRYKGQGKLLIDAVIADYERLGTAQWVGYTFAWIAHFYAIQGNGQKAFEMLEIFWKDFCGPNGFHLNGDYKKKGYSEFTYRPFTLEGNMFAADALQEMLFQMCDGEIQLFPAVPEEWKKKGMKFYSFRGEQGLLCSAGISEKLGIYWEIRAGKDQEVSVGYGEVSVRRYLKEGEVWRETLENIF